jgi:hypothetical protein
MMKNAVQHRIWTFCEATNELFEKGEPFEVSLFLFARKAGNPAV